MARGITKHIPEIDDVIVFDVPWVKNAGGAGFHEYEKIVKDIQGRSFDAAVVFTVYSQNPLPTAMLAYHAGIPKRLAYCRENPYDLLTDWLPDEEPYSNILHQVERDLRLVHSIGAYVKDDRLQLSFTPSEKVATFIENVVPDSSPWVILHPGVSEKKREYPHEYWTQLGRLLTESGYETIITGSTSESEMCSALAKQIGKHAHCAAGKFQMGEFIDLVSRAKLAISVNTATIHIAAAVETPVITLYALTNPQHSPWKATGKIFPFSVDSTLRSKNEVLSYVTDRYFAEHIDYPDPREIFDEVNAIIRGGKEEKIPKLLMHSDIVATS